MKLSESAFDSLVTRKREGGEHTHDQIENLVAAYTNGDIDDERFALWLRAVVVAGLSDDETAWLTQAMAASGVTLSWDDVAGVVVDKHSTGGVGDAVSLIAVPLAAACGVKVAKLSGRALGHTGGTIDKLECVPHLRTALPVDAFKTQVTAIGCAIAEASAEIAPADKKIYALRHRTNTVRNIGLITASILSKKIAGGAPHIVIDVKCGRSAFMTTLEEARALARAIAQTGRRLGRSLTVLVTDMDSPLALSVGDELELAEAIAVLQGAHRGKLCDVALAVAEAMLAGTATPVSAVRQALLDGSAYERFATMVAAQGGELAAFAVPQPDGDVKAEQSGFIEWIDGRAIAEAIAMFADSGSDFELARVGVRMRKSIGDEVDKGDALADVFAGDTWLRLAQTVREAVRIGPRPPDQRPAVIERMHAEPQHTV